jgi:hypothetical protein
MNQSHETPPRAPFDFSPARATPIVEVPARWPQVAMATFYVLGCALAGYLLFSS